MLTDSLWKSVDFAYPENGIALELFITAEEQVSRIFFSDFQTSCQYVRSIVDTFIQLPLWIETIKNLQPEISEQRSCTLDDRFRESITTPLAQVLKGLREIIATQTIVAEEI